MALLFKGRWLAINNERARYRALRRSQQLTPDTPHDQLYPLIDVVFSPAHDDKETGQDTGTYSGFTVADLLSGDLLTANLKQELRTWLCQDEQVKQIEQARNRLMLDEFPLQVREYDYPSRLYSTLRHRLELLPQQRATAAQWRSTILNMKRDGVRGEEITWSGVLPFLDDARHQGGKAVNKYEVLRHIDFSSIRLNLANEMKQDGKVSLPFQEIAQIMSRDELRQSGIALHSGDIALLRFVNRPFNYRVGMVRPTHRMARDAMEWRWFALDPNGRKIAGQHGDGCYSNRESACQAANHHARDALKLKGGLSHSAEYEYVSLTGGKDYREWLVTLPDYHRSHYTAHYLERNVLLHIRTKVRNDIHGRRLLFIEELQSDWHQAGARHGYDNWWWGKIPNAPFRNEWVGLAIKLMLLHAVNYDYQGIAWTPGGVQEARYGKSIPAVRRLYDNDISHWLTRLGYHWGGVLQTTHIQTKEPWLHVVKNNDKCRIRDASGKYMTRARYTMDEALKLVMRHCKTIDLPVPVFLIPEAMTQQIKTNGLPLFGEFMVDYPDR